ncbi:MAG TPA: phosphoribosylanthranilate isomerase [Chthoniobacterales bacterium]
MFKNFFVPSPDAVRVKICGVTTAGDAAAVAAAGADAIGLVFYPPSKRFVRLPAALTWLRDCPPGLARVALLVNAPLEEAEAVLGTGEIDAVQLHGDETLSYCARLSKLGKPVIKALRVRDRTVLTQVSNHPSVAFLLDAYTPGAYGGSGLTFDWRWLAELRVPFILSGGLTPENVHTAVRTGRPFAVDVSSGVESSPGKKDPDLVARFVAQARLARSRQGS